MKLKLQTTIYAFLLLICTAFTSQAQYKKRTVADKAEFFTKEITDYIPSINEEQRRKLVEINMNTTLAFDSLKALNLESNEYKPAARQIFVSRDAKVKEVLTTQQYDEYLMLQAEKKQKALDKKKDEKDGKKDNDKKDASKDGKKSDDKKSDDKKSDKVTEKVPDVKIPSPPMITNEPIVADSAAAAPVEISKKKKNKKGKKN